jgi:8-oxo-dGTP pyrophosphatase MutT (NUDIX family)
MKRVALLIAVGSDNKILLQHKSKDAPNNPDTWCLFGGGVEDGETPEQAIKREIFEELQVEIIPSFFKTTTQTGEIERNYFSTTLQADSTALRNQQREGDNLGYFSLDEMGLLKINEAHYQAIRDFLGSPS